MTRRLLPFLLCALFACAALSASPLTVYFTGTCSDCTGLGANGTVNASITFAAGYFYNIDGPAESTNLAYGDFVDGTFTGVDTSTTSITKFVYDGSNKQALISATGFNSVDVNFGWEGKNPFPGPQSVSLTWGDPASISYEFDTVLNSLSTSGDWSFNRIDNNQRITEDQGTNAVWSFTAPPPSTVPEPATLAELAGGLGLLGALGLAGKFRS